MANSLLKTIEAANNREARLLLKKLFPDFSSGANESDIAARLKDYNESTDLIKGLLTSHNIKWTPRDRTEAKNYFENWQRGAQECPLHMSEALMANDATIVLRRVVSDVLMMPEETVYIGQDLLATTIQIDGVKSAIFPALGAITAFDIAETQEYPEQSPSFTQHALELRVQKSGLKLAISDEIIEDSMWDIFGLYVTMASHAMKRHKEEKIFNEALAQGHVIFDNTISGNPAALTSGVDKNGVLNGTLDMLDLMDIFGGLIANGYTPTDLVVHPLTWVVLAKDPRLLFQTLTQGMGQNLPMPSLGANSIQKNLPFGGINVVVSPQVPFNFDTSITMNGSAMSPCNVSSILCVDRKSSLVVLQRDTMHMDQFEHPERDIKMMKVAERYAVGALDMGRGITIANNIRLVQNHKPVLNLGFGPGVA